MRLRQTTKHNTHTTTRPASTARYLSSCPSPESTFRAPRRGRGVRRRPHLRCCRSLSLLHTSSLVSTWSAGKTHRRPLHCCCRSLLLLRRNPSLLHNLSHARTSSAGKAPTPPSPTPTNLDSVLPPRVTPPWRHQQTHPSTPTIASMHTISTYCLMPLSLHSSRITSEPRSRSRGTPRPTPKRSRAPKNMLRMRTR